ncbi:MAG: M14-type cytosolic carboxypeptidase [Sphingomonadales bacterium]|jgi:murein tripeptide amidase MpaA
MHISSVFDGGNIIIDNASDKQDIQLRIRKDNKSDFYQWFYFRVSNVRGEICRYRITNAGGSAYVDGWKDYKVCASYDRDIWFRIDTEFDGENLIFSHEANADSVYFAYFAPYSMERHADLIADISQLPHVSAEVLGQTLDGQDMDLLTIGTPGEGKKKCWMIARQHPGETMAEWWMEGALERLSDIDDPVVKKLLDKAVFYIVPNMNPDGSKRGHLRTNAAGANLNREWANPTAENSPEVLLVLNKMDEIGVDFSFDVHGDEALPYNFIAGFEGIPSITDRLTDLLRRFENKLEELSPDFQTKYGYPTPPAGKANLTMGTNQIAERFDCLSMTLEMPFKDNADLPDDLEGWSPTRCKHLARECLATLAYLVDDLR